MKFITSIAVIAELLVPAGAMAQGQGTAAQRAACTSDVFRLCSSQIPDVDAIRSCLRSKKPSLSADCRSVFDTLDKPVQSASTRSIIPRTGFCDFTMTAPSDDDWRKWCGKQAFSN